MKTSLFTQILKGVFVLCILCACSKANAQIAPASNIFGPLRASD